MEEIKIRVRVKEQWRDFDTQKDAKEYAIDLLNHGIFFMELSSVNIEEPKPEITEIPKEIPKKLKKKKKLSKVTKSNNKFYKREYGKWSDEVFEYVRKNLHLSNKNLTEEINKKFGLNTTEGSLGVQMAHQGINRKNINKEKIEGKMGRPKGALKYTPEQIAFIKSVSHLPDLEILKSFNERFGTNFPEKSRAIYNFMDREGMISKKRTRGKITPEIGEFIKSLAGEKGNKEIVEKIMERFGINASIDVIKGYKHKNNIQGVGIGHGKIKKQKGRKKEEELTDEDRKELEGTDYDSPKIKKKKEKIEIKDVPQEIQNYVSRSKITVAEILRDNIIEKFEKDIPMAKIKKMMDKRTGRTPLKWIGQIHYDTEGNYTCNPSVNARPEKLTKDKKKVTCANCQREIKELYPEEEEEDLDLDYEA